jgi:hypothetical protein
MDIETIPGSVHSVYGSTATLLTRPTGATTLVLMADKGAWRVRVGDHVVSGMPAAADPTASITDGTGAVKIKEGEYVSIPSPAEVTVKGYAGTDALTYFWT